MTDLRPLSQLNQLTTLVLGIEQVQDLGPIADLHQLQSLGLVDGTMVSHVGALGELGKLTWLWMSRFQQVTDLGPLSNLAHLSQLRIWYSRK